MEKGAELFGTSRRNRQYRAISYMSFLLWLNTTSSETAAMATGKIDQQDSIFASLRLWQDTNHNGVSEASELHALDQLDVTGLDLNYKETRRVDQYGNRFAYRAKVFEHTRRSRWEMGVGCVPSGLT